MSQFEDWVKQQKNSGRSKDDVVKLLQQRNYPPQSLSLVEQIYSNQEAAPQIPSVEPTQNNNSENNAPQNPVGSDPNPKKSMGKGLIIAIIIFAVAVVSLVVLVGFGFIAYFNVLSPNNLVTERCTTQVGFNCESFSVVNNQLTVNFGNDRGTQITVVAASLTGDSVDCSSDFNRTVATGSSAELFFDCPIPSSETLQRYDVVVEWTEADSIVTHTTPIDLLLRNN